MENNHLSLAYIKYLMNPGKANIKDILTISLQELTVNQILSIRKINSFPNGRSRKTQKYIMIFKGEKYDSYEPLPHEVNLLSPFQDHNMIGIKILTNFVLKKFSMHSSFISDKIYGPLSKNHLVSGLPLLKSFGVYSLSSDAKAIVDQTLQYVAQQELKLQPLIDGDKKAFIEALTETGGYVFFMAHSNPALYKDIVSMTRRIYRNQPLGADNDLTNFHQAFNFELVQFESH